MKEKREDVLDALKFELQFIEKGGYSPSVREPHKELSIFRDSPSCLNYADAQRTEPCDHCWLMNFVPFGKQGESVPCHHIPLNEHGATVESLSGDGVKVQDAMQGWLRRAIEHLEQETAKSEAAAL